MKKLSLVLLSLALAVCFLFAGCNKYGVIKKAYEDAGYVESTKIQEYQSKIDNAFAEEDKENITAMHLFARDSMLNPGLALIVEFRTTEDLIAAVEDSATLQGFIEDAQNSPYVSGNCVLIFWLGDGDTVFASTK